MRGALRALTSRLLVSYPATASLALRRSNDVIGMNRANFDRLYRRSGQKLNHSRALRNEKLMVLTARPSCSHCTDHAKADEVEMVPFLQDH